MTSSSRSSAAYRARWSCWFQATTCTGKLPIVENRLRGAERRTSRRHHRRHATEQRGTRHRRPLAADRSTTRPRTSSPPSATEAGTISGVEPRGHRRNCDRHRQRREAAQGPDRVRRPDRRAVSGAADLDVPVAARSRWPRRSGYLLSVGASFGASVAVFQWGWFDAIILAPQGDPMLSTLPIILVGVLFGLAMDYQVFLVSRIQEMHNRGAVTERSGHQWLRQVAPRSSSRPPRSWPSSSPASRPPPMAVAASIASAWSSESSSTPSSSA